MIYDIEADRSLHEDRANAHHWESEFLRDFREPFPEESYEEWSLALEQAMDAAGIPRFNPSHEQAAADSANRHAPEDWITRAWRYPAVTQFTPDDTLPF